MNTVYIGQGAVESLTVPTGVNAGKPDARFFDSIIKGG